MKILIQITLMTFLLFFSNCSKLDRKNHKQKETLLIATQNFNNIKEVKRTLTIFSDSTYTFIENLREPNHNKDETFEGLVKINKDSIKFHPFKLDFNNAETAVLKNGFIEFIDGENPDRMKIEKTTLPVKNNLNLDKFPNYAVFTFNKNFDNGEWQQDYSNYDLNTRELSVIDQFFKKEFLKNKKLRNFDEYLKQIVAVKNSRNEILIQARFFCKTSFLLESYQYYESDMHDGGNCNIYLEFNLTTRKFNFINIAGMA